MLPDLASVRVFLPGRALMGYRSMNQLGALTTCRGSNWRLEIDGAERAPEMLALLSCALIAASKGSRWRSQSGCVSWVT